MSTATSERVVNPYDAYNYPSLSFVLTHIGRLAAIGRIFGMETPDPAKARVLELGCGTGINLLAMAQLFPNAEFIGVDYAETQISIGLDAAASSGIANARFIHADFRELGADLGEFDYIIAHGIYSWISDEIKEVLLRLTKKQLSPNGLAYVSYNTLPGWKMRGALRDMMLMHTGNFEDTADKVTQAKALIEFLASASNQESPYGKFLKSELDILQNCDDAYIMHEFLEADNDAFYFMDFHRQASESGLFYLGDAEPSTMMMADIPDEAQNAFAQLKGNLAATEQYLDFLRNRTFRCSLLCHPGLPIQRDIKSDRVMGLQISSQVRLKQAYGENQSLVLELTGGGDVTVHDTLTALIYQQIALSGTISTEQLIEALAEPMRESKIEKEKDELYAFVGQALLRGYFTRIVDFYVVEHALPAGDPEKPKVLPLAYWQAANKLRISNRTMSMRKVDFIVEKLIQQCDGTRTQKEICEWILEGVGRDEFKLAENNEPVANPERRAQLVLKLYQSAIHKLKQHRLLVP